MIASCRRPSGGAAQGRALRRACRAVRGGPHMATIGVLGDGQLGNGIFFCLIILALSLSRLWRRTFYPLLGNGRAVGSSSLFWGSEAKV